MKNYTSVLTEAVKQAKAPGAVAYLGTLDATLFHGAAGQRQITPVTRPAEIDTLYDLASLTKVIATTTAIMLLREDGLLDLDAPVSTWIPLMGFKPLTPRHLLTHTSGLPPGLPLYHDYTNVDDAVARIAATELRTTPGEHRVYSDLGFITLGKIVEAVSRKRLDKFCHERIFAPLAMKHTGFTPPAAWRGRCAATEYDPTRGGVVLGSVHDENAAGLGGITGHAGLFAPAGDLALFCRAFIRGEILPNAVVEEMLRFGQVATYPWQGLGWKMDPWMCGSEAFLPSRAAFGHTGWTGTSIWMDRQRGIFSILLSNTCHPSRTQRDTKTLRTFFHAAAAVDLYPARVNTHTGLDRIVWDGFDAFAGQKIALLTHGAAADSFDRTILDVFKLGKTVRVERVYSPEHGFLGKAEAGERVGAQTGPVPIISLYGERKRPTPEELKGLDAFVVDLQDVGARYYTYMATMKACMEVCAQAGVPVHILDRPNPLGGLVLEGPIAKIHGSNVCCAPIPIRHGMTLGETALYFKRIFFAKTKLDVIVHRADDWPRDLWFPQLSLPWRPPSPNIPTPESALLYIGTCLFEGVNINEGRGTDTPFTLFGAPWLDAEAVVKEVEARGHAGITLEALRYTPRAIPGKSTAPRYKDTECNGIRIHVGAPLLVRGFALTVDILAAVQALHPDVLTWGTNFDTLAGGPWLRERVQAGAAAKEIAADCAPALALFDAARPRQYLSWDEISKTGKTVA